MTFETELTSHMPKMRKWAMRYANGHRARAEDLVQDTLLKALANKHRYRAQESMTGWLRVIMRNVCFSDTRRAKQHKEKVTPESIWWAGETTSAETILIAKEVCDILALLPQIYRQILLASSEGLTIHELAEKFTLNEGTVKSRLHRARSEFEILLTGGTCRKRKPRVN